MLENPNVRPDESCFDRPGGNCDRNAPPAVRKAFRKQLVFLEHDLRHPSPRTKKYDETKNRWQARVNKDWRFYFTIEGDIYYIQDVTPHPK